MKNEQTLSSTNWKWLKPGEQENTAGKPGVRVTDWEFAAGMLSAAEEPGTTTAV